MSSRVTKGGYVVGSVLEIGEDDPDESENVIEGGGHLPPQRRRQPIGSQDDDFKEEISQLQEANAKISREFKKYKEKTDKQIQSLQESVLNWSNMMVRLSARLDRVDDQISTATAPGADEVKKVKKVPQRNEPGKRERKKAMAMNDERMVHNPGSSFAHPSHHMPSDTDESSEESERGWAHSRISERKQSEEPLPSRHGRVQRPLSHSSYHQPRQSRPPRPPSRPSEEPLSISLSLRILSFEDNSPVRQKHMMNAARGLLYGCAIGDSMGSYCEFAQTKVDQKILFDEVVKMPGGGYWKSRVSAGQVTDDTEMAVCLARACVNMSKHYPNRFKVSEVAEQYRAWIASHPFDIGNTVMEALEYAPNVTKMRRAASTSNVRLAKFGGVQSNGSLMRAAPLIVWGHRLTRDQLYLLLRADSSLSHANEIVYFANALYGIACQWLIWTPSVDGDKSRSSQAIKFARQWILRIILQENHLESDLDFTESEIKSAKTVFQWFEEAVNAKSIQEIARGAQTFFSHVKIGFQHAFFRLKRINDPGSSFESALLGTIEEGGDTDTNACIVGGLLGAFYGYRKLPSLFRRRIKQCQVKVDPANRDPYQGRYLDSYLHALVTGAPSPVYISGENIPKEKN